MVLNKKGIVKLDKTISDYLPGFVFNDKNLHPEKITMRALLTHTHGIKNNDAVVWTAFIGDKGADQVLDLLKKYSSPLPNTNFSYSNLGPVFYSLIVEKQMGQPWQQVMDEQVFQPLGMRATTCYISKVNPKYISYVIDNSEGKAKGIFDKKDNSMSAAGGHFSTVNDLLKYLQFFMSEGNTGPGLLNKEEIDYETSAVVSQKANYQSYRRYGYGIGWEQSVFNGEHLTSRLGGYSGIASHLSFINDKKIGIVVLSNKKGMEPLAHLVANYIYNSLLNKANKEAIVIENLISLKKNMDADATETREVAAAIHTQIPIDKTIAGHYDGDDKSGTMDIKTNYQVTWGNLSGRLYMVSDTSGLINFGTMLRSLIVKKAGNKILGVYSNDRFFTK